MILNTVMNQHATVSFRVENSPTELINSAHSFKLIGFIIHFVGDFNNYFVHTCNQSQIAPNKSFRIMKHQWKWPNLFKKFTWNHFLFVWCFDQFEWFVSYSEHRLQNKMRNLEKSTQATRSFCNCNIFCQNYNFESKIPTSSHETKYENIFIFQTFIGIL